MLDRRILSPLVIFVLFLSGVSSQTNFGRLYSELNGALNNGQSFSKIQLFSAEAPANNLNFQKNYSKANYWIQDSKAFSQLQQSSPSFFSLELTDYQHNTLTILLEKQELFGADSRLLSSDDPMHGEALQSGFYYKGIVKEYPGSIAAFSFFEDQTIAVLALPGKGNLVLGKMKPSFNGTETDLPHVLYYENELPQKSNFQCGTDQLPETINASQLFLAPDTIYTARCKTTKIFLECDFRVYTDHNNSITQVKNYITGLFNVVKTLYYNEQLNIEISDIMVWTSQDPYLHTDLASIIYNYAANRQNNFTGNLAQLITTFPPQQQGGIAFLATLCQPFNGQSGPFSFAFIYNSYSQLPTYSWSVEVMTHEMGHNFGSPHTHACAWGPNRNMTLDNCQNPESNCAPGPPPTNGGTIMSYCHLTNYGINLSNGFGIEPGNLIRNSVQVKTCLSSLYSPVIVPNVNGPYFDGDNIILKARPSKSTYSFDWFHYDYLMLVPKDSILRPTYTGIYKSAISDGCSEYSQPDTVQISDFLVNLGCPVIKGFRDSLQVSVTVNFNKQTTLSDSLTIPDSLYLQVPAGVKDILVEYHTTINAKGNSWFRDVATAYQSPVAIGISNNKFAPNATEPAGLNGEKTYSKTLGRFNPKGVWHFTTNYIRFVNGTNVSVTHSIVISWRKQDSIPPCRIALCDGQSKTFDAGITSAKYAWSTGATTKTISTNEEGSLSVQVTKGSKKASHTVELYYYPTNYNQSHVICNGDTLTIGKHHYTKSGVYSDSLIASNGCDSIIASTIEVLPTQKSRDSIYICYGELYDSIQYFKNALLTFHHTAINGCDSIHEMNIIVDSEIKIQSASTPACPEIGGSLDASVNGGSGSTYKYEWSNGRTTNKIDSLSSGVYQVKVIDSSGCSATKDLVLKNLDSIGMLQLVFNVSCYGKNDGRIYLDFVSGLSPITINWSTGEHTKDIFQLLAGKYKVSLTDANGCRLDSVIEVGSPELLLINLDVINSTGNDGSAKANIVGGTPPFHYDWSTGETSSEIVNLQPGNYSIKVTDQNGCEARFDFVIQQVVATNQSNHNDFINVFPIPVKDKLIISIKSPKVNQQNIGWKIYDVHSRLWNEGVFNLNEKLHSIDLGNISAGVYILEMKMGSGGVFRKVILKE